MHTLAVIERGIEDLSHLASEIQGVLRKTRKTGRKGGC